MKFAPEGYPFIAVAVAATFLAYVFGGIPAAFVPVLVAAFMFYFFRDPERTTPQGAGLFIAPADGKVILIRDAKGTECPVAGGTQISIFMSPLNVHVNRVPCDGTVKSVRHVKGGFLAAYRDEASLQNEHIDMLFETEHGDILLRQVAGFVARRAVCRVQAGDTLVRGARYGIIKFSSRVDVCLPAGVAVTVAVGDRVAAGETIIASIGAKGEQ